jgi:DNA-binding GntR family transcriptional regulator
MKKTHLKISSQKSIVDIVTDFIRSNIIEGKFDLNEKISTREIAGELKISRTPIREAIRKLESEGLVELLPRKGFILKRYDIKKIEEIYEVRKILELHATELACKNISHKEINGIKETNEKLTYTFREKRKDILELARLNKRYHFLIYQASRNEIICEMIENLWYRTSGLFIQMFTNPDQGKTTPQEHNNIIEALERRDTKKVVKLLDEHLKVNKEVLLKYNVSLDRK